MSRKKKWVTVLCASFLLLSLSSLAPRTASATKFLSFGTGSPAGTYYFIGAGFAAIINKFVPGVRVTAESTAASTENARLLIRGELDLGLACMGTLVDLKKQGMDVKKVRLVAVGHTSDTHWIVRKDSSIKSISDFKGKTIGVGPAGSATLNIYSKKHLKVGWGLNFSDFNAKYIAFHEISRGIRDNTIDAGIIAAGRPHRRGDGVGQGHPHPLAQYRAGGPEKAPGQIQQRGAPRFPRGHVSGHRHRDPYLHPAPDVALPGRSARGSGVQDNKSCL